MAHPADVARGRNIVARWCNLAERRLEYLTELFETGRWRRYHSEQAFLENIREAKAAVERAPQNRPGRISVQHEHGLVAAWFGAGRVLDWLLWPAVVCSILTTGYTGFLFAQGLARDLWQGPQRTIA